jgi:hypothetical protein
MVINVDIFVHSSNWIGYIERHIDEFALKNGRHVRTVLDVSSCIIHKIT